MSTARMISEPVTISVLDAAREASRSAHRWRDRAAQRYTSGKYTAASTAKWNKDLFYRLKDRGIVYLHQTGLLRYAGTTPQGMAVYEYGEGGMSCLHSTLHPAGVERAQVDDHPEVLFVAAKKQKFRLRDVIHTLRNLPDGAIDAYQRAESPQFRRPPIICFACFGTGHTARFCTEEFHDDMTDFD